MLFAITREHLAGFLRHADEQYARPLPKYVRRAFYRYLRCGLPEHGLLRVRCDDCGHDRVVAFSCKERGVCPSCAGRTMANTAAHLVDRVLPNVPIRQWVLSLPFELRAVAAKHPRFVSAVDRILFEEVQRFMRRSAGPSGGRAGAVTFVQRFGGSLNLHVHFHVLFLEGLFTKEPEALPVFHPALAPTRTDLLEVLARVRAAVLRWVARRDLASAREEPAESDALDACARAALQPGLFDRLGRRDAVATPAAAPLEPDEPAGMGRHSVALDGFNLHASVRVGADDDQARERLVRYCARPAFALERLTVLPDGRIAYRIKQPRKNATHRILTPIELLARIAALIPPPRQPFLRYHGVLAPNCRWRSAIVPRPEHDALPTAEPRHDEHRGEAQRPTPARRVSTGAAMAMASASEGFTEGTDRHATRSRRDDATRPGPKSARARRDQRACFATIHPSHHARLEHGKLLARGPRLPWRELLRRTFAEDVLVCPRCRGRARIVAAIQDPAEATRFLAAVAEPSIPIRSGARAADDDDDAPDPPPPSSRPERWPVPDD